MKQRRLLFRARWLPRLHNQEADDLTNDEFRRLDPAKRIKVNLKDLQFRVMDSLFEVGDSYIKECAGEKGAGFVEGCGKKEKPLFCRLLRRPCIVEERVAVHPRRTRDRGTSRVWALASVHHAARHLPGQHPRPVARGLRPSAGDADRLETWAAANRHVCSA